MKGRKPLPDNVKRLRGTYRSDRARSGVEPSPEPLVAPEWLRPEALPHFKRLAAAMGEAGTASATFDIITALAASVATDLDEVMAILRHEGLVIKHPKTGNPRPHPCVAQRDRLEKHFHSLLTELGLTPASVARASKAAPQRAERNPFGGIK